MKDTTSDSLPDWFLIEDEDYLLDKLSSISNSIESNNDFPYNIVSIIYIQPQLNYAHAVRFI